MNSVERTQPENQTAQHSVEFFRLPPPGKRDPFFGLSRGWYYKAHAAGEIRMVAVRHRGALRGVRLVVYDSVRAYSRRAARGMTAPVASTPTHEHNSANDEVTDNISV